MQLKELVRDTVVTFAKHCLANDYSLLDATGQGTSWGKTSRGYFSSDYTFEDNTLNSLVLLNVFKLAYYVSGEKRWNDEYLYLANEEPYKYADLAENYWRTGYGLYLTKMLMI